MLDDNDYEAYFGSHVPTDDSVGSLYTSRKTLLQRGPSERPADTSTFSFSLQRIPSDASSIAGWTVTSQLIQPKIKQYRQHPDLEESSNFMTIGTDYSIYNLPVYDTDDGAYCEIDLDAETTTKISSASDPQLILIKDQAKEHDEEETTSSDRSKRNCLSRLCLRFLQ